MSKPSSDGSQAKLDLGDVDQRVGEPVGGGQLREPCSRSDIRRWVMTMDHPDPVPWDEGFAFDEEGARIDPRLRDGLDVGPSRGHIDAERAGTVGMARAHGYGATIGAWCNDPLAFWAGHEGMLRHVRARFRAPAFEGDVTYVDGEVTGKEADSTFGVPRVGVALRLSDQGGGVMADATAEVELPL